MRSEGEAICLEDWSDCLSDRPQAHTATQRTQAIPEIDGISLLIGPKCLVFQKNAPQRYIEKLNYARIRKLAECLIAINPS